MVAHHGHEPGGVWDCPLPFNGMVYTQAQIEAHIAKLETEGMTKVEAGLTFESRGVTYKSVASLEREIGYWKRKLEALLGRGRQTLIVASKGFD